MRIRSFRNHLMQLIRFAGMITDREFDSVEADRKELAKMLTKIVKTSKGNA